MRCGSLRLQTPADMAFTGMPSSTHSSATGSSRSRLRRCTPGIEATRTPASLAARRASVCEIDWMVGATMMSAASIAAATAMNATGTALDPVLAQQIIDANNTFPWNFTTQPFQIFAGISLPIFNGLQRETRVSQAKAQRDDATEEVRAQSLLVRSQVTSRYLAIGAAYQAIGVAEANKAAAADQLRLAQDRYRLGQGTALELSDAEGAVQRADGTYVDAIYGFHKAVVALEEAVGQPLR